MNNRGFTLLELLVAMAIFATAGLAIMQASSGHIRALSQIEELTIAGYVANNQLQLAMIEPNWPPREILQGEVEMANRQWLWRQQTTTVPDGDLRQLVLSVSLAEQPDDVLLQLTTFIGKPSG
jgi:general secretion pathway protein I